MYCYATTPRIKQERKFVFTWLNIYFQEITLVMVTHDVGLKEFADRVIWMSDGKIKNVEVVDPELQRERINRLQEETEV